jgi:release factor glutamine methyltransferase
MDISSTLASAGISLMEAEVLIAHVLQCNRTRVLAHPEKLLTKQQQDRWEKLVNRRRGGEPVSYITGEREFYKRMFHVDKRVHIPRPSTENLVTMALDFLKKPEDEVRELDTGIIGIARVLNAHAQPNTIVDICTGSGCIAITLALERPDLHIIGIDISPGALAVARSNARKHRVDDRITFMLGDLLDPVRALAESFTVISNPPYLSGAMITARPDIQWEPHIALDGGKDGIDIPRKLFEQAEQHPDCVGIIMECLANHQTVDQSASANMI